MRLSKARIQGYRSIKDSGYFEIENFKTIFVGTNEAGKTAILQALQRLNPPTGVSLFDPLRDYPRSRYAEDIITGKVKLSSFTVVEGHFCLESEDVEKMPVGFKDCTYICGRYLDNSMWHRLEGGLPRPTYIQIEKDMNRLSSHIDQNFTSSMKDKELEESTETTSTTNPSIELLNITQSMDVNIAIPPTIAKQIISWLDKNLVNIDENNTIEEKRFDQLKETLNIVQIRDEALQKCESFLPKFLLFNNYFRVKPSIHLQLLARRTEENILDDDNYDYGNNCLLKLLGFSARELSQAGDTTQIDTNIPVEFKRYKDQLDKRDYRLNSASVRLTKEIINIWNPNQAKGEASKLRIKADGQYLKVVVEDEQGVEVELDQRSEGFQWIVSFFVVFFAETEDKHKNAILLLDEPGMSLHGLKQAEFRGTISKLCEKNQTIFTTHSPFLVGANELDLVRVVEMTNREIGTTVHTTVTASDAAAMLPLQEALGYDLAQSLFVHQKNIILEGLTDYWYIEAISNLSEESKGLALDKKIALIPASSASKVVYFATILHAQNLKVAALLDSDSAGEQVARQDTLVSTLGNKRIIRTKDVYKGLVLKTEIEDLLRDTLVKIAKDTLGWDIVKKAKQQVSRPIVELFSDDIGNGFSKYKLAKAFLRWSRENDFNKLTVVEQEQCSLLIEKINKALK